MEGGSKVPTRIIEVTDGQQSKPLKVNAGTCTVVSLLKEGKNKLRKKYKYVVYQAAVTVADKKTDGQLIVTDDDLRQVLRGHDAGKLVLLFTNKLPRVDTVDGALLKDEDGGESERQDFVVARTMRGVTYIIGNEDATEDNSVSQLRHASELRGCIFAVGMPDLHAGRGIPIGAVVMTDESVAYPQLVDNDIGCGMSFVETSLHKGKLSTNKARKIADSLDSIDCPYASTEEMVDMCSEGTEWATRRLDPLPPLEPTDHYQHLGTVGGGNHFAELQEFDDIYDAETIERYGIDVGRIHLLVHSGSRSLGSQYLSGFCERAAREGIGGGPKHGHYAVGTDTPLFEEYLRNHNVALNYATRNRKLIARRLLEQITGETEPLCKIDIHHNFMERVELQSIDSMKQIAEQGRFPKDIPRMSDDITDQDGKVIGWIHRKGATPTTQSRVLVIPGSRGSLSYLVEVNEEASHGSGYSLAHGAGRRMKRSKALAVHKSQYPNANQLLQTDLGGVVICEKKDLVYEEAPASYKDIDTVVQCLADDVGASGVDGRRQGLVRILGTLRPLLTYKYKNPYGHK